jgi:hypothetical protein
VATTTDNPGNWSSGGTWSLSCGNQTNDAISATPYTFTASPVAPTGAFLTYPVSHVDVQYGLFSSSAASSIKEVALAVGGANVFLNESTMVPAVSLAGYGGTLSWNLTNLDTASSSSAYLTAGVASSFPGLSSTMQVLDNGTAQPVLVSGLDGTRAITVQTYFGATGVASGTYTSGGSISGSATQTCTLTSFNDSSTATATVALTGSNTIAGGTALVMTSRGGGATAAPTSATLGNGTATCSGTATIATVLGGTPGYAWMVNSIDWRVP